MPKCVRVFYEWGRILLRLLKRNKNKKEPIVKVGYDTAFMSVAIIILNLFLSIYEFNIADLEKIDLVNPRIIISAIVLMLSNVEIFYSYRRYYGQPKIIVAKLFSSISFVFVFLILLISSLMYTSFLDVDNDGYIVMIGNIPKIFNLTSFQLINKKYYWLFYTASTLLQAIASCVKMRINKEFSNKELDNKELDNKELDN